MSSTTTLLLLSFAYGLVFGELPADSVVPPSPTETQFPAMIAPTEPIPGNPSTNLAPSWPMSPVSPSDATADQIGSPLARRGWFFQGETMFLQLSRNSTQPLVYDLVDVAPGMPGALVPFGPVVTTNNISNQSFGAVPRFTLGYQYDDGMSIEGTYFGRNDWFGSTFIKALPPTVPFLETPDGLVTKKVWTSLASAINSFELNVFEKLDDRSSFEFLTGFRYFGMNEQFRFHSQFSAGGALIQSDYNLQTTNNLYGAQIGLRWNRQWHRLSIAGAAKTGIYANDASQEQFLGYRTNGNGFAARDCTTSKPTASFIQELGVNGIFQVNDWCSLRAGYNLFVISRLARVGDQIDFTATPFVGLDVHGTAVLHGPSAGIEFRF